MGTDATHFACTGLLQLFILLPYSTIKRPFSTSQTVSFTMVDYSQPWPKEGYNKNIVEDIICSKNNIMSSI